MAFFGFGKIRDLFKNIGAFVKSLFTGNLKITSDGEIYDRMRRGGGDSLLENSSYDHDDYSTPYSDVGTVGGLYDAYNSVGPGAGESLINKETEAGITGQQAGLNEMQLDNMRRQYGFQVSGMKEAGLNPALMYNSGVSNAPSAPSPTQGASMSDLIQLFLASRQAKLMDAEVGKTRAETESVKQNTQNAKQEFDLNEILNPLKVEAQRLANNLSSVEIKKIDAQVAEIRVNIKKLIAETASEKARKAYLVAEKMLAEASAKQIVEMLPYSKALAQAQTAQARAAASLASVQAAYQQKLLDSGQVEAIISELEANAKTAEAKAQIQQVKSVIYTGDYVPDYSGNWLSDVFEWSTANVVAPTLAGLVQFIDNINPLSGLLK